MKSRRLEVARSLLRAKDRRAQALFLAEGPHVVRDALDAGAAVLDLFVGGEAAERPEIAALVAAAERAGASVHRATGREVASISGTETPQGIVGIVRIAPPPARPFTRPGLWLLLDGVQDPGNVGTLLRAAEAFGAAGALATEGTADFFGGKVVRAAQGAHFRLALYDAAASRLDEFAAAGGVLWAATVDGDSVHRAPAPPPLCALALGSESRGLSEGLLARAARRVGVPQRGRADSLNVAMAGSILLSVLSERRGAAS